MKTVMPPNRRTHHIRQLHPGTPIRWAAAPRKNNTSERCASRHKLGFQTAALAVGLFCFSATTAPAAFTPLTPLSAPRIVGSAPAYPGGSYDASQLLDGKISTEYSSDGRGTETFVEFEFPGPVRIGAFRHVDRNDPATIAGSQLTFLGTAGGSPTSVSVTHVNQRGGETFLVLPQPITARRVRWHVTKLGQGHRTVGGAELAFYSAGPPETDPSRDNVEIKTSPILEKLDPEAPPEPPSAGALSAALRGRGWDREAGPGEVEQSKVRSANSRATIPSAIPPEPPSAGALSAARAVQELRLTVHHPYAEPVDAILRLADTEPRAVRLVSGHQTVVMKLPAVTTATSAPLTLEVAGRPILKTDVRREPVKPLTVYVLPHSHTDIGYTEIQTEIEDKQVRNLIDGMAIARRTASFPPGARFVWNVEVTWAADLYLRRLDATHRRDLLDAIKSGQVALNGMYLNELTGLCRPEELIRLFRHATQLGTTTGVPVESAMISDVPGYTWGTVNAMAHAGLKYFSVAPNYFDRIGDILVQWENKPFYWIGPDGRSQVLVWIPFWGYAMSHRYHQMSAQLVEDFCAGLAQRNYPYDIAYVRWSGHGDNAVPDPAICEFVRDWNRTHLSPQFIISSATEAFRAFEQKHGASLPRVSGDWTPYWEDGAGSSALETAQNRASSDRVAQAETTWALLNPRAYPAEAFEDAWRNVLLYSEHTWGAWCSISEPFRRDTREQWAIKQSYAVAADLQSRELLSRGLAQSTGPIQPEAIDVFNTTSWPRSELVTVPKFLSEGRNVVTDDEGRKVPSQRLRGGELVLLAHELPSMASRRYTLESGPPHVEGKVTVTGHTLDNGILRARVDEKTGGIVELRLAGLDANLADATDGQALNEYLYFNGDDPSTARRNGPVKIRIGEAGPLVASLIIDSPAPGCHQLSRELRLVAGSDALEIINTLDKDRLMAVSYHAKEGKESLNFGFPFAVPDGQMRLEIPFGVIRPDVDQIASACKNWFTVNRWADVSNDRYGITWITLDAPLVQVGGLTANLINSQSNPAVWRKKVGSTQKLYSWAMNNHWGTNYRAYQEGPHVFRFILRPHRGHDPVAASRLAIAASQPLLPTGARGPKPPRSSRLSLTSPEVLVTGFKPSDDGRALILRLWGATGKETKTDLTWSMPTPAALAISDSSEQPRRTMPGPITVPPWGVVTVRAELP